MAILVNRFDSNESKDSEVQRQYLISSSGESDDEEWIEQLQRDYGRRKSGGKKKKKKWTWLEIVMLNSFMFSLLTATVLSCILFYSSQKHGETFYDFVTGSAAICPSRACVKLSQRLISRMDESINPCHSFYDYTCGKWLQNDRSEIEASKITSFREISERTLKNIKTIILQQRDNGRRNSVKRKVYKYFQSCLDQERIEKTANESLIRLISFVGSWSVTNRSSWHGDDWSFGQALTRMHRIKSMPLFDMFVAEDPRNSGHNIIQLAQSGLTLGNEDFYKANTNDELLNRYKILMKKVAVLLGAVEESAVQQMEEVFEFEKELASLFEAKTSNKINEKFDKMSVSSLQALCPAIPWLDYMNSMYADPVDSSEEIIVYNKKYLSKMSELVTRTERRIIANYMVWHLIKPVLHLLSKAYKDAEDDFENTETTNQHHNMPSEKWRECVKKTEVALSNAVGHIFVDEMVKKEKFYKPNMKTVVHFIQQAAISRLSHLSWLDGKSKAAITKKIKDLAVLIGYPDWVRSEKEVDGYYEKLNIMDDAFENYLNIRRFYHEKSTQRRGKKFERSEWHMAPTEVNSYYNSRRNNIVLPLAILQHPLYSSENLMSTNFGAIGSIIGQQIARVIQTATEEHFKLGRSSMEKTPDRFIQQLQCFRNQSMNFDSAVASNIAELLADYEGLQASFLAFQNYKRHNDEKLLPGLKLNGEKSFFLSYAQVWCTKHKNLNWNNYNWTSQNSPEKSRVDITLSNMKEFSSTFKCGKRTKMNPENQCTA